MSKAERIRQMNARQRIAKQQAAARRAEARRRMYLASGSVLAVIAIVVGLIIAKNVSANNKAAATTAAATAAQASKVTGELASVPAATLDSVGTGSGVAPLQPTQGSPDPLTSGGKPEVVYMGAEYCPYCAAERWSLVVALSRFGTFSNLGLIHSSSTDVDANTPTLTFYKSSYTSKYLVFDPVEMQSEKVTSSGQYATLQTPTAAESKLMSTYDGPPYVTESEKLSYPFVDIGNKYLVLGAQYQPTTLSGLSWSTIASQIKDPNSSVAKGVDGAANTITAAICKILPNAPSAVCNSQAVQAGAEGLDGQPGT